MATHSKKYDTVEKYWLLGLWNETMVRNAVVKLWITEDEFFEITGINYAEADQSRSNNV